MTIPWPVLLAGLLIIAMSIPLIKKRIPKNDLYGFRTPKTMAGSEAEWLVANQRAGWALCAAGIVTVIGCLFFAAVPLHRQIVLMASTSVLIAAITGAVIYSIVRS